MTALARSSRALLGLVALVVSLGFAPRAALAGDLVLSGANEVPAVQTGASGEGRITVAADGAVSGSVKTKGMVATMAHIHLAPAGKTGPVIIPLERGPDGEWSVPAGTRLDAAKMKAFQAGELYVNVHSDAHKGGEVRAQLTP